MDSIRINEEYIVKKTTHGFDLVWTSLVAKEGVNRRNNEKTKNFPTWTKHYGVLYQAMCGFVKSYIEEFKGEVTLKDIEDRADHAYNIVSRILGKLSDIDKAVAEEWKTVKHTVG